jgi:murein DD-endopeptidase MepM/ murein hydrolase activator NlpD
MDEQLHIIITGDRGRILRLPCSKIKLRLFGSLSALALIFLIVSSIYAISLYAKNREVATRLARLEDQIRSNNEEKLALNLKVANLKLANLKQAAAFEEEKDTLISNAVSELNERSEMIGEIMGSIGIDLQKENPTDKENSGGPFIEKQPSEHDDLLFKADTYLNTIRFLPLGEPTDGTITSQFGKRKDPVNNKSAFHTGIDFRANKGDKVYATADGTVKKAFRNGSFGNYILIDHGNGYTTSYAHMQALLVKAGDQVARGQLIGLVGNTGRSTGPHLHYEIALDDNPINPYNFIRIATLQLQKSETEQR